MHTRTQPIVEAAGRTKQMFAPIDMSLAINVTGVFPGAGKFRPLVADETESRRGKSRSRLREHQFLFSPLGRFELVSSAVRQEFFLI